MRTRARYIWEYKDWYEDWDHADKVDTFMAWYFTAVFCAVAIMVFIKILP